MAVIDQLRKLAVAQKVSMLPIKSSRLAHFWVYLGKVRYRLYCQLQQRTVVVVESEVHGDGPRRAQTSANAPRKAGSRITYVRRSNRGYRLVAAVARSPFILFMLTDQVAGTSAR